MDISNYSNYLPTNLFDDEGLSQPSKREKYPNERNDKSVDNVNSSINNDLLYPVPIKYKSSNEIANESTIFKCNQLFTKKKLSDQLSNRAPYPQYTPSIMCYPPRMRTFMPPQQSFDYDYWMNVQNQKAFQTVHTQPNHYPQYFPINEDNTNDYIRHKKSWTCKMNNNQYQNHNNIEDCLYRMSIKQIIEAKGSLAFINFIKTRKGSCLIQDKLQNLPLNNMDFILSSISLFLKEIMCDNYANFFFQELMFYCSGKQRYDILKNIQNDFNLIAQNSFGTHSLQKLIILHNTKEEEILIKDIIENNLLNLSLNENSSHIIDKVVCSIPEQRRESFNSFLLANLITLCLSPNGIIIVQKFIQANQSNNLSKQLITIFEKETLLLTCDQYGNFGIQEAIQKFGYCRCFTIIKELKKKIVYYSSMKYSSNVIDSLIKFTCINYIDVFDEIINKIFFTHSIFNEMTKNKYGNFVLENAIELLNHDTLIKLKSYFSSNCTLSTEHEHEKKIYKMIRNVK